MKIPAFPPHLRVQTVPGDGVYLISEHEHRLLAGRLYECCAPHVNGQNSVDHIVDLLAGTLSPAEVYHTLSLMAKKGVITDAAGLPPHRLTPYWTATGTDPAAAARGLETAAVSLTVFGDVGQADRLTQLLEENHIRISGQPSLGVVVTDDFLNPGLDAYNQEALANGTPWLLVKPKGLMPAAGPLFIPEKTACWRCFSRRNRRNRLVEAYVAETTGANGFPLLSPALTPGGAEAVFAMAVREIIRYVSGTPGPGLTNGLCTMDLKDFRLDSHRVDRLPNCPACGSPARPDQFEVTAPDLASRPIAAKNDGGFRICTPEETLDRFQDRISPVSGVVTGMARNLTLGRGFHVYHARSIFGQSPKDGKKLRQSMMMGGNGKGMTRAQAKVSCLCEALECATLVYQGDEKRITASLSGLGEAAVHPDSIHLHSRRQLENAGSRDELASYNSRVPLPIAADMPLEWSPIWSLTRNCQRFVLTESLYFDYGHPDGKIETRYAVPTFNGTASGNCLEEAVLHAFFELVERDCIAIWWYNRLPMPGVDLESFHSPYCGQLLEYYHTQDRRIWVLDLTNDLGIPVFVAMSGKEGKAGKDGEEIIFGFGCHLDPGIALHRALTEMNQLLAQIVLNPAAVKRGDPLTHPTREWLRTATRARHPWLTPAPDTPLSRHRDFPRVEVSDLLDGIRICRERMEALGLEVLVKDQTRPEIGLSVATVMVPGLRHFWPRFAPGRLYDVPVKMGWQDRPLTEAELNPTPCFL